MTVKNNFTYILFMRSGSETELSAHELLRSFDEDRNTFIMDYGDARKCFNGIIQAEVLDDVAVGAVITAYERFTDYYVYPADFISNLLRARQLLQQDVPHKYSLSVDAYYREDEQF